MASITKATIPNSSTALHGYMCTKVVTVNLQQLYRSIAIQDTHLFYCNVYKMIYKLFTTSDNTDTHIELSMIRFKIKSAVNPLMKTVIPEAFALHIQYMMGQPFCLH